ncbi:MAG: Adaptive-response sensory-kinase SasA [Desulfovibrio sp.]
MSKKYPDAAGSASAKDTLMTNGAAAASPPSGKHIFGFSPWLLIGLSLVLGAAVFALSVRGLEKERGHTMQNYFDRAEALIWALEAGARTERGDAAQHILIQALIEETARQSGILYMSLVGADGRVLAHSDPAKAGTTVPRNLLPATMPTKVTEYAAGKSNEGLYEVYRGFSPLSQAHEPKGEHGGGHGYGHGGHQTPYREPAPGEAAEVLEKEEATSFIFVGFDKKPFDDALAADYLNNLLSSLIIAALGLGGFISLFWAHSHRNSRRKLKDTQALASEVVTSLPLGLITSDPHGAIGMCNATALAMFGLSAQAVRGKPVRDIPGLDWDTLTASLAGYKKVMEREMPLTDAQGRLVPISVSASEIRGEDGLFLGHLFILRDVTEIKRLQMEAQRNERLTALGNLAAGVAHEIRNPLSSIKGLATYIAKKMQTNSPEEEAAKTVILEVDRLNRVVAELLEFARPGPIKLADTDIDAVITRALRLSDADVKAAEIRVNYAPNPELPHVLANAERLTQALLNLFLNAVQAMPPDGELCVRAEKRSENEYAILVADTGQGIAPDALASIFTPYFTTKASGTGLGLAIVHQIIEGHGGTITVTSEQGHGSTFTLLLPLNT